MRNNCVVIASNACFLADTLGKKLRNASFQVFNAATDKDLDEKIKAVCPGFIFMEDCFHGYGTDVFIQRMVKKDRRLG